MSTLGFDNYVEPLKAYLQKYREVSGQQKINLDDRVSLSVRERDVAPW